MKKVLFLAVLMSIFISCDKTENDSTSISKTKQIVQQVKNQAFSKVQGQDWTALITGTDGKPDCRTQGNICAPETPPIGNGRFGNNSRNSSEELRGIADSEILALYDAGSLTLNKVSNSDNSADLYIFNDSSDNETLIVYPVQK